MPLQLCESTYKRSIVCYISYLSNMRDAKLDDARISEAFKLDNKVSYSTQSNFMRNYKNREYTSVHIFLNIFFYPNILRNVFSP